MHPTILQDLDQIYKNDNLQMNKKGNITTAKTRRIFFGGRENGGCI
jgi:hypothetical protein